MILYNWWQKYFLPEIKEELDSHLADAADYYLTQGFSRLEAEKKAQAAFGSRAEITTQLLTENSANYYYFLAQAGFLLLGLLFLVGFFVSVKENLVNAYFLKLVYAWLIFFILLLGAKIIKSIINFWGPGSKRTIAAVFCFVYLFNLAIVIFYDIDAIELAMQNTLLLLILFVIIFFLKKYLSKALLKISQMLFIIITLFTISQRPILGWVGTVKCLYVTPDDIPLSASLGTCQQVFLWKWSLWPLWLATLTAVFFFMYFIFQYLKSQQLIRQKAIVGITSTAMIFFPLMFYDSNNFHRVEMVNWQPQIIRIYRDILGRDPEAKDLEFYASHQTYLYMQRIEDTLYASAERTIKIKLLFQKILNRQPSVTELNYYVENKLTITEIKKDLKKKQ